MTPATDLFFLFLVIYKLKSRSISNFLSLNGGKKGGSDGKAKKEEETGDFVSAVSWRTGTNVIAAANSQGMIKVSTHHPDSHYDLFAFQIIAFSDPGTGVKPLPSASLFHEWRPFSQPSICCQE